MGAQVSHLGKALVTCHAGSSAKTTRRGCQGSGIQACAVGRAGAGRQAPQAPAAASSWLRQPRRGTFVSGLQRGTVVSTTEGYLGFKLPTFNDVLLCNQLPQT